jgi:hypothetical protein
MSRPWRQQNPRVTPDEQRFTEFSGVVNTRSRKDLGLKALYDATNVVISDTKKVVRRDGYSVLRSGNVRSAYSCGGRLYIVDGATLYHMASVLDLRTLITGLTGTDYHWADINGEAFFTNGVDAGICRGDAYLPWRLAIPTISGVSVVSVGAGSDPAFNMGATYTEADFRICATFETEDGRETAPSEVVVLRASPLTDLIRVEVSSNYAFTNIYVTSADGTAPQRVARQASTPAGTTLTLTFNPARSGPDLTHLGTRSLPAGATHICFDKGRCYAAQYLPSVGQTVVWFSKPLAFHLWDWANDYLLLPGQLGVMVANNGGVLLGTTHRVYQYDGDKLEELVDYGVLPGAAGATDAEGVAYFWTERGICKAMPFENLTEKDVSMPTGLRAAAGMVYHNGQQQFITVTQGTGDNFNSRTERALT